MNLLPEQTDEFKTAISLLEHSYDNLFITGKAGTGKSTLLEYFCKTTQKNPVVLATTGVAALNVSGQTIHSFFKFHIDVTPDSVRKNQRKPKKPEIYKKLKMIIIDEVSMLRADLLDCIDEFLKIYGPVYGKAFGGVQMVFIGDLHQLPPIVRKDAEELFSTYYKTPYFFSAFALNNTKLKVLELKKIYRQSDQMFINLLNKVRNNLMEEHDIRHLNSLVNKEHTKTSGLSIVLTTLNKKADVINDEHLNRLNGKIYTAKALIDGEFSQEYYPTSADLKFKIGAQIMLLNNDRKQRWVNGTIGVIEAISTDENGDGYLRIKLETGETVSVHRHTWEVYKFSFDGKSILHECTGEFSQYPFRLAWAVTIHKSQGKTFNQVVIDVDTGAFASGQIYVALSRCTSFEGITLRTPIKRRDIRTDQRVIEFLSGCYNLDSNLEQQSNFL